MTDVLVDLLLVEARQAALATEAARQTMMNSASRRQEAILSLHAHGLSVREIAARLDSSAAVVQTAIATARNRRPTGVRREERISYELHIQIAQKLPEHEQSIRKQAKLNLEAMRKRKRNPIAQAWLDQWAALLDGPVESLRARMLDQDPEAVELRQMSPFAGVLGSDERRTAIERAVQLAPK